MCHAIDLGGIRLLSTPVDGVSAPLIEAHAISRIRGRLVRWFILGQPVGMRYPRLIVVGDSTNQAAPFPIEGTVSLEAPSEDVFETYWRTYFANIFNPARLKVQAMKSEMPMKYWKNLPEAELIPQLIQSARPRMAAMIEAEPTEPNQKIPAPIKRLPKP